MLLPGFFALVEKAPGPSAKQELKEGEPGGGLWSLLNGEQYIGQEQVPVLALLIHLSV